ncbi:hypothetical protein ABW19_dt0208353 [Dactylella cylindrospora]|nr:hypothetical protein ABW19_dt0208353 [Dactylella cylindrospora]
MAPKQSKDGKIRFAIEQEFVDAPDSHFLASNSRKCNRRLCGAGRGYGTRFG